jgi:hypothetical protein
MKKQQAVNLWRELNDTTDKETVYRKFSDKPGYGGERTLIRFTQVNEALGQTCSFPELATRTGWSKAYLDKVVGWWQEEFGKNSPINQGKGPIAPLEVRSATPQSEDAEKKRKHHEMLLVPLDTLTGIEPLPIDHTDQMYFYVRHQISYWPIPKGRIWRDTAGQLTVHLRCEHDCQKSCQDNDVAWDCLCQHLNQHPLGGAIIELKTLLAQDISDRLQLLAVIEERASQAEDKGGIGLNLIPDLSASGEGSQMGYGPYYLLTVLHQSMSRRLQLPLMPKRKEEFQLNPPGTIQLGSFPVIQAADPAVLDRAVDWLLEMQDEVVEWPETRAAGESYSIALAASRNVQRQLDLLQLQAGVPAGSRCDSCPTTDGSQLRDRPVV